jgi:PBSX family phage terminase large subunit
MAATKYLADLISPSFYDLHQDIRKGGHSHYWLKGGRGSTKSSFIAIEVILGIMAFKGANAVALRKVGDTLRDSAYEQYLWATEILGVRHLWHAKLTPMRLIYKPTGQRVMFRGADKPEKIKSIKFYHGYARYIHYEEFSEFGNMADVRSINQSLVRGGEGIQTFYSYNPPSAAANWVNLEVEEQALRKDTLVHHSTYLDVPKTWLGDAFLRDAKHLKKLHPERYAHEYLGEKTGTGAEVFTNLVIRPMPDREVAAFDKVYRGLDFGFAADPCHYTECYFDAARKRLYVFSEIHKVGLSDDALYEAVKTLNKENGVIVADSAEPRTINELRMRGLKISKAKKGRGSVEFGIKWLQGLEEIIIDPERCPNTTREFTLYELERDHHGNLKGQYSDKNNHSIDAIRYAVEGLHSQSRWLY